jgi:hypothetical protein
VDQLALQAPFFCSPLEFSFCRQVEVAGISYRRASHQALEIVVSALVLVHWYPAHWLCPSVDAGTMGIT